MRPILIACAALLLANLTPACAQSTIVRAAGGDRTSLGVGDIVPLSPSSAEKIAQIKLVEHPGYRTPLHVHERTDESFYVLAGSLTFHADGRTITLGPGDYVFIPRGTPHAQGNLTASDTVLLTTLVPGDFAAFFRARAELVRTAPPEHPDYGARMRALGKDHDIKLLGPTPF
ncbi:cupin domain-containing protein [Sphingomonas sp. G-3-2-10]|uniref:cupin domain-containing protein n=1 Tax=Sphingomonas sp. G-3-2-10 TaxID=2728838 RepID=UPI00146A87E3|nr:cupin domain-containing protein [Sphingomonas sp. G-3-2-10]NML07673.1 cupin domain-containing protein [Sphingomonas sp. G-3-2-10]